MAFCPVKVPPTSPIFRLHPPPNLHRFSNQELETLFGREVDFQNQRAVLPGFPETGRRKQALSGHMGEWEGADRSPLVVLVEGTVRLPSLLKDNWSARESDRLRETDSAFS